MATFQDLTTTLGFDVSTEGLDRLNERLAHIGENVKIIAGFTVAEALYGLAERFAGLGENLESSAIAAGLTTEELQKLQFAASQNAVDAGALNGALSRLGRLLYQAQKGSKGASEAFAKLGISREQIAGFATAEDALLAIQDGIGGLSSQQEKLAVVQQLFGRSGARFLKFLEVGSDETRRLKERAAEMGAVVSNDGVKALAEFEDAASGLGQVLKGFLATVASTFAPGFIHAIHAIEDAWMRNRKVVADVLDDLAYRFGYVIGYITVTIGNLSEILSAILYRRGGIGEFIGSLVKQVLEAAREVSKFLSDLIAGADKDGLIKRFFADVSGLLTSLSASVKLVIGDVGRLFDKISLLGGIKMTKLEIAKEALKQIADFLHDIMTVLQYVLDTVQKLIALDVRGFLAQFGLGKAFDKTASAGSAAISSGKDFAGKVSDDFGQIRAMMSLDSAVNFAKSLPTSLETLQGRAAAAAAPRSVVLNSNVTVNAPPGMTGQQAVELFGQKQKNIWMDVLRETDRDTTPAMVY